MSRFIYIDESGISYSEPVTVVAGIIVKDKQWRSVERYINRLIEQYVRKEDRNGFVFHATDLFQGSGKFFGDRTRYPLERSREALKELLKIPSKFHLPIVYGVSFKNHLSPENATRRFDASKNQSKAFGLCVVAAESFLTTSTGRNQVATLVAENNTDTKNMVAWMHRILQGKLRSETDRSIFSLFAGKSLSFLPIRRIIDTVHFTRKSGAPFLQIADACALVIRYYFEKKPNANDFINALTENKPDRLQIGTGMHDGWAYVYFPRVACVHKMFRAFYVSIWAIETLMRRLRSKWRELQTQNQQKAKNFSNQKSSSDSYEKPKNDSNQSRDNQSVNKRSNDP